MRPRRPFVAWGPRGCIWPLWMAVLLSVGCAGSQSGPKQALSRYKRLLSHGKYTEAYQMMTPALRQQCDLDCFTRRATGGETARHRDLPVTSELRGEIALGDKSAVKLTSSGGGWNISGDPLDFYPQTTPRLALHSLLRALQARRYDVALRFIPARLKGQVTADSLRESLEGPGRAEMQAQVQAAKQHLDRGEPFVIEGTEARLPLGGDEGKAVRLVQEPDGENENGIENHEAGWRVLQLQ